MQRFSLVKDGAARMGWWEGAKVDLSQAARGRESSAREVLADGEGHVLSPPGPSLGLWLFGKLATQMSQVSKSRETEAART